MKQFIFSFDDKKISKLKNKKNLLGGKGANLAEMGKLGLPVPPGFTITTEVCDIFYSNKKKLPTKILSQIKSEIKKTENKLFHDIPSNLEKLIKLLKVLQNIFNNSSLLFLISLLSSFTITLSNNLSVNILTSDRLKSNFS